MSRPACVPEAGDIVWFDFDPQAGHEQAGHRPALVLSPAADNGRTGLMVCCPLTTRLKGYPFEAPLRASPGSVVLADQMKSLGWRARAARRKGRATAAELAEVRARLRALIGSRAARGAAPDHPAVPSAAPGYGQWLFKPGWFASSQRRRPSMSFTVSANRRPVAVSFFEPGLRTWQLVQEAKSVSCS